MDLAIQAILIIGAFSLAHERVVELVRSFGTKYLPSWVGKRWPKTTQGVARVIEEGTRNGWAALTGTGLAILTNANMLKAFSAGEDGQSKFFECYLNGRPSSLREFIGCALMGLAVTYGSVFWHDLAKLLIDTRGQLNPLKRAQQEAEADKAAKSADEIAKAAAKAG